jgi:hypothetical protein
MDRVGELQSVHAARHLDVGKKQRDIGPGFENCEGGIGVHSLDRSITGVLDHIDRPHPQQHLVFNDENDCGNGQMIKDHHDGALSRTSGPRCAGNALPAPTPTAAAPAAPATSKQPHDKEQQYRTDSRVDDCTDHSNAKVDAEPRQQPASDKGAQNPDKEVTNDPEAGPLHDLTRQPACNETDKQDDQQAFTRHIHFATSGFGSDALRALVRNWLVQCGFACVAL